VQEDLDIQDKNNLKMKIIIPMAGMGKRMRPHTLTIPKPLIPIAGKPIVQRLVEELALVAGQKITEIAFIIGDFGSEVEENLCNIAKSLGATPKIYYQHEALGTGHAILCAADSLNGNVIIAFADTLFKADFKLDINSDASIWVQKVEDPSSFGVVKLNEQGYISDFIEKPKTFVSDLAIIGIYYFKEAEILRDELQKLIDNKTVVNGEYQLTDALENMKNNNLHFKTGQVKEWLDCGNKNSTVFTNQRILEYHKKDKLIASTAVINNSIVVEPCFIGENVVLENSIIGPYVSVGRDTKVKNSIIKNSIIQRNSQLKSLNIENSMIGNYVDIKGDATEINIGDYASISK
jgi:glucose-1-phosphate thymidylyltransferase